MSVLLVVEDDADLAEGLQLALSGFGHTVRTAASAEEALVDVESASPSPDLAVIDVMLPGMDGFELVRLLSSSRTLPMVLLTARTDPIDVVVGLECGADDYIGKPVEPRVLDARIKAVLRRAAPRPDVGSVTRVGSLLVDEQAMTVHRDGREVPLTPTELRLFLVLLEHSGQVLSRRTLLERVWDHGWMSDSRLVDACVQRLRAKVEDDPVNPALIKTVRGVGYRMQRP